MQRNCWREGGPNHFIYRYKKNQPAQTAERVHKRDNSESNHLICVMCSMNNEHCSCIVYYDTLKTNVVNRAI